METTDRQPNVSEKGDTPDPDRLILVDERELDSRVRQQEQTILGEDRLLVLCDGVFAIAATLLVLDIKLPSNIPNEAQFNQQLGTLLSQVFIYVITFVVIAGYWSQHRGIVRSIERVDARFTWLTFLFLAFVAFFPVTSSILGAYGYRGAVILYILAFAGCGYSLIALWLYAAWNGRLMERSLSRHQLIRRTLNLGLTPTYFSLSLLLLLTPLRPTDVFWSWLLLPVVF
ncbi:MAG TPA: TMEM175 family protein, partial [Ktedonobacterales bacterium]|nr:TMEM175 family protein [Ktedonobacterales bacterium]